jgi:hypothetical protein
MTRSELVQKIDTVERFIALHHLILRGHISSQEVRLLLESTLMLLEGLLADLQAANRLQEKTNSLLVRKTTRLN